MNLGNNTYTITVTATLNLNGTQKTDQQSFNFIAIASCITPPTRLIPPPVAQTMTTSVLVQEGGSPKQVFQTLTFDDRLSRNK